jgi:hypothetical protein
MENECKITPRPGNIKEFFRSWYFWKPFLGITLGGLAGFMYFYFVGCRSGSCPITGSAWSSVIVGGLFGFFITNGPCCSNCK